MLASTATIVPTSTRAGQSQNVQLSSPAGDHVVGNDQAILESTRIQFGGQSVEYAKSLLNLAGNYIATTSQDWNRNKRLADAKPLIDRALEILEKSPGIESNEYATGLNAMGNYYLAGRRRGDAAPFFHRAFEIFARSNGPNSLEAILALYSLEQTYREQKRGGEAIAILKKIVSIKETALGPDHDETLRAVEGLASGLRSQCRDEEADRLFSQILPKTGPLRALGLTQRADGFVAKFGVGHPGAIDAFIQVGNIYTKLGKLSDARLAFARTIVGIEKFHSEKKVRHPLEESSWHANAKAGIAEIDRLEGRLDEAESGFLRSLATLEKRDEPVPPEWLDSLQSIYESQGRGLNANAVRVRAQSLRAKIKAIRCP